MTNNIGEIILSQEKINNAVKNLAKEILGDYPNILYFVTVLEGAKIFGEDLMRQVKQINKTASIYHESIKLKRTNDSNKPVEIIEDFIGNINSKEVIVLENIVNTGATLNFIRKYLMDDKKAKSVKICSFINRPFRRSVDLHVNYTGFYIPFDLSVVGYGIDYNENYRELPYIAKLEV